MLVVDGILFFFVFFRLFFVLLGGVLFLLSGSLRVGMSESRHAVGEREKEKEESEKKELHAVPFRSMHTREYLRRRAWIKKRMRKKEYTVCI